MLNIPLPQFWSLFKKHQGPSDGRMVAIDLEYTHKQPHLLVMSDYCDDREGMLL